MEDQQGNSLAGKVAQKKFFIQASTLPPHILLPVYPAAILFIRGHYYYTVDTLD